MNAFKKEKKVSRCFTIREELALKLDEISERFSTSRSRVVEHCLEQRDNIDKVYDALDRVEKEKKKDEKN